VPNAYLILGIGTEPNNAPPAGVTAIGTDDEANFVSIFQGQALTVSFLDTGSWDLSFPPPTSVNIPQCSTEGLTMYCPTSPVSLTTEITGANGGAAMINLGFTVMNGATAWDESGSLLAFNDIADPGSGLSAFNSFLNSVFDFGLPIFYGKTIYFGMDGMTTTQSLGQGPYDAM
jgi:hypothetical protein